MVVQRLKVAILPLDLPCSGPVTHSGEILTTGKSYGKKPDRFSLSDNMIVNKFLKLLPDLRYKYYRMVVKYQSCINEEQIKIWIMQAVFHIRILSDSLHTDSVEYDDATLCWGGASGLF